ncbi:MAG: hypothetical protein HY040_04575 [Planctomycetes bacterium]|nr:hypothetical protein [Planctomycetota bacterium]
MFQDKLKGRGLLEMIDSPNSKASVLIELDRPMPKVEFRKGIRHGKPVQIPKRVSPLEDAGESDRIVSEARERLTEILGQAPHWLKAAGAFVATVGGDELKKIAELPHVSAIWLNREHRLAGTP